MPELSAAGIQRVVLVGAPGAGKSRVAAVLARRLRWRHLDLDREIERRAGCTVAEIFRRDGEAAFRALEEHATMQVSRASRVVLSPGGGWLTNPDLLPRLQPGARVVWLSASLDTLLARLGAGRAVRPLLATTDPRGALERLVAQREPLYRAAADVVVATDGRSVGEIVTTIAAVLRNSGL